MKTVSFLIALFLSSGATVRAGSPVLPAVFCEHASLVEQKVMSCEDNDLFIQSGERCLEQLEKAVLDESKKMASAFSENNRVQLQSKKFESSLIDYSLSSASLQRLIESAATAMRDVELYKITAALPEDADEPEVTDGNPEAYGMSVDCYGDTQRSLDGLLEDFDFVLSNLEDAKLVSDANAAASKARKLAIGEHEDPSLRKVSSALGAGSAIVKKQPKGNKPTITGVKEDAAKRSKALAE